MLIPGRKDEKIWGKWLYIPNPQPVVKNRVFCLHYAAVSAEVYHNWCLYLMKEQKFVVFNCLEDPLEAMKEDHCYGRLGTAYC